MTRSIQLSDDRADRLCWKWTADRTFSTASAYQSFFIGQQSVEGARLLRKAHAPAKCKFFIWLVQHDKCWTAARRRRHGLQDDDSCVLCEQAPETIDHLLIQCPFARELWFNLFSKLGWEPVSPSAQDRQLAAWWTVARKCIRKDGRQCFDSVVILVSWMLWKERNNRMFERATRSALAMLAWVVDESVARFLAGIRCLEPVVSALGTISGRTLTIM